MLVIRTCDQDMRGYHGKQWPLSGRVEGDAKGPLYGLLNGIGNQDYYYWTPKRRWLVIEADACWNRGDCVFFWRGTVLHVGTSESAYNYLEKRNRRWPNTKKNTLCSR